MAARDEDPRLELFKKRDKLNAQLLQVNSQVKMKQRAARSTELTIAEVKDLPPNTNTYRTVGRMFLASPLPQVLKDLGTFLEETKTEISQMESKQNYLVKQAKSLAEELKQ
eukprot:946750-Amorphochlora_amoeboformis.AAC.2